MHGTRRAHITKRSRNARRPRPRPAFTLIETMFAIVIIGLGVVVILRTMMAFLTNNMWSTHSATATYLAGEIREMTRSMPRHDRFAGGLYFTDDAGNAVLNGWGIEQASPLVADINDIDDLDGAVFGNPGAVPLSFTEAQRFPEGPVNAFGEVITQTNYDGSTQTIVIDEEEVELAMQGWSQLVTVEKLDPYDFSVVVPDDTFIDGQRDVDEYPLRVTVTVIYEGVFADEAPIEQTISWIVPPR